MKQYLVLFSISEANPFFLTKTQFLDKILLLFSQLRVVFIIQIIIPIITTFNSKRISIPATSYC